MIDSDCHINTHLGHSTIFCSGNSSTGLGIPEIKMTVTKCALIEFFDANSGDMSRFMHTSVLRCYRLRTFRRQKRVLNILFKKIQFALCAMQRSDQPTVTESLLMQCQCGRNCVTFSIHLGALRRKFASLGNLNNLRDTR